MQDQDKELGSSIPSTFTPPQTKNSFAVYCMARNCLGKNLCEDKRLGCAETVNAVVEATLGYPVGGGASTFLMYQVLKSSQKFQKVLFPLPGDIIISPTGYGSGKISNGHVGIVAYYGILSNNSFDGLLEEKYTLDSWKAYYQNKGGFPVLFYRPL